MAARVCPFCDFNEGWVATSPIDETKYVIRCKVCGSMGPQSSTREGAERKWNGFLKSIDIKNKEKFDKAIKESNFNKYLKPKSKEQISSDLSNILDKYGHKMGDIVSIDIDIVNEDSEDNYREILQDEYEKRFIIPYGLKLINWEDDGPGGGWPLITLEGPIENIINWGINVNGPVSFIDSDEEVDAIDEFLELHLNEDMGGVSGPMSTLGNTTGIGNAQPASQAAMTGSQQGSPNAKGSGDKWGNSMGPCTQDSKKKKKKKQHKKQHNKTNEQSISPYDEIGKMMAKRMNVPLYFEKGNDSKHVKQKEVENMGSKGYKYKVATLDDFKKSKKKK